MMYLMTLERFTDQECVDVPFESRPQPRRSQMTLRHAVWQGLTGLGLPGSQDPG